MSKTISVIIPIKNRAHLLPQTLDNILSQSVGPYEVIVVDDGSTDDLDAVEKKYKGRVIFTNNEGKGPGAARNKGFNISTGKYIQFFDSDDLMTQNKLEVQSGLLNTSGSGMVYSPHVKAFEDEDGHWHQKDVILYYHPIPRSLRYDQWVIRGACMITQACLFDRDIFRESGIWRTDLMPHEDLEFLFRIGKVVNYPVHTNECAVIYRQHGNQITDKATDIIPRTLDGIKAMLLIKNNMKEGYSFADEIFVKGKIFNQISNLDAGQVPSEYKLNLNLFDKFAGIYARIFNKCNRIITKSDWELYHGINSSPEIFNKFVSNLNKKTSK